MPSARADIDASCSRLLRHLVDSPEALRGDLPRRAGGLGAQCKPRIEALARPVPPDAPESKRYHRVDKAVGQSDA